MNFRFGSNFAVFLLFFGVAAVEALRTHDAVLAALFAALGVISLWADRTRS